MMYPSYDTTTIISWVAPTENSAGQLFDTSGVPDRTLAGYRIYYGTDQSQVRAGTSTYAPAAASPATITNLTTGTWYFRVTALDGDGDESLPLNVDGDPGNPDTLSKVIP
jgi:hypothetical protein